MRIRLQLLTYLLSILITAGIGTTDAWAESFGVGFFEAGAYPAHADFRSHFRSQLQAMAPSGVELDFVPDGFKSAEWERDKSKAMAAELASNADVDLVVALGPWTVEDLLEAGFNRPIVAALRFDPALEGLVDERYRPIVDNLTVRVRPRKLESDLTYLTGLLPVRKLGMLYFPSSNETDSVLAAVRAIGERFGFEVVTGEGVDRNGTYAFFKAYRQLARQVDALYLPPLWGFNSEKVRQFYSMVSRDGTPAFASDGAFHVDRGALAAGSREPVLARAHYHAWKVVRIIEGAVPADLPTVWPDEPGLYLNQQVAGQLGMTIRSDRRYDVTVREAPPPNEVERLTAVDAVALALANNPGYQARYATLEAAGSAAAEAQAAYLPQVELGAGLGHFDNNAVHNDDRYRHDRYRVDLTLNQELFSLGTIRDIQLAKLQRDGTATDLRQARLDLELAVTLAYLDVLRAEQLRSVIAAYRRETHECLQLARLRLDLNEGEAADVWRWEAEWLAAVQAMRRVETDVRITRILLNTLLGRPGDYPFALDWTQFNDARFFHEESILARALVTAEHRGRLVESLLGVAAANNPALARSNLGVGLGQKKLARNQADFYPRIGFYANLGLTRERAEYPGFKEENPSWSIGANIRLPLFQGGRRFQRQGRLQSELDGLEYRYDQTALDVAARLRVALEKTLSRAEEFPMAARAAELADQYYPEILAQYGSGQRTLTELLDALAGDRDASHNAIVTQIDYFRAVAQVIHIAGLSPAEAGRGVGEELLRQVSTALTDSGK